MHPVGAITDWKVSKSDWQNDKRQEDIAEHRTGERKEDGKEYGQPGGAR